MNVTPTPTNEQQDARDLDPMPFVWPSGVRSMFTRGDGQPLTFAPRPEYEQDAALYLPHLMSFVAVSAPDPDEREALIRLGAQAAKDRDARNVAQVVTATVDAILAARPAPTVSAADVEYAIDGAIPDDLYGYRERYTRHAARRVLALLRHGDADHPSGCLTRMSKCSE